MGTWATVLVALIVALSTLGASWLQNKYSHKRFKSELERAREVDKRQRRWEVRGEPLLQLRTELALMATKQDKLGTVAAGRLHTIGGTEEQAKKALQQAVEDWNAYWASGDLAQTLLTQDDAELVNKVRDILKDYQQSCSYLLYFLERGGKELSEALKVFEGNKTRIIEVQSLINQRLEEL